jgi:hypothetical protein
MNRSDQVSAMFLENNVLIWVQHVQCIFQIQEWVSGNLLSPVRTP